MDSDYYALIMAGGGGTRLWPLSRQDRPKQVIPIVEDRSLFRIAVDRVRPMFARDHILVATVPGLRSTLERQAPELSGASFLDEPSPKGTASVIGLAAVLLNRRNRDSVMACLTADHFIGDEERFRALLGAGYRLAKAGSLVTLGVRPSIASTGYGYLKLGMALERVDGFLVHQVDQFKEKPDRRTAEEYLASGEYLWNSGMFIWRTDRILAEIERQMPTLHAALERIGAAVEEGRTVAEWGQVWSDLTSETIDYGIMEGAEHVVALVAEGLNWMDVGTWDRLLDILSADDDGNVVRANEALLLETQRSLVYQDTGDEKPRLVVTMGVEDLVIVDSGEAVLIASKSSSQKVREIVDQLREQGLEKYL